MKKNRKLGMILSLVYHPIRNGFLLCHNTSYLMKTNNLPVEIWILIASYLDGVSLRQISELNKHCHQASNDNNLWKNICKKNNFTELIQDLSDERLFLLIRKPNWKRVFIKNYRLRERNAFIDLLTKKVSEDTLFGSNLRFQDKLPDSLLSFCKECSTIEHGKLNATHSISIWEHLEVQSTIIQHTLSRDCCLSSRSVSEYNIGIPKRFIIKDEKELNLSNEFQKLLLIHQ